nr:TetR/AcrR family transcriptional regulator [Kibdelosporangium sp. MJ126-NF4]CEL15473.1 Transcriptional regulator, TetR family [Kibdelosporangium sp. MJ126-NF4]CTQ92125.1 Transcriptional regulator, TetR family [Kibdelosporangium sp. MJ126-NF4]
MGDGKLRAGRPRDVGIDHAAREATLTLMSEVGYRGLAMEAIARRAGTNKAALYRRWSNLPALVLDALGAKLGDLRPPDTNCTICDLCDAIKLHLAVFRRLPPDALASLHADCDTDETLRATFTRTLFDPPRAAVAQVIDAAFARGDLRPTVSRDLVLDLVASLAHYRVLFGHSPTSDKDVEDAVHALLRGMASDYAHLVAATVAKAAGHPRHVNADGQVHDWHAH